MNLLKELSLLVLFYFFLFFCVHSVISSLSLDASHLQEVSIDLHKQILEVQSAYLAPIDEVALLITQLGSFPVMNC